MAVFKQKYVVQKGRTVTCRMGIAHEGAVLTLDNFSGNDEAAKQKIVDALVDIKALAKVPLTDAEKEALAELEAEKAEAEKEAQAEAEKAEARKQAILGADFEEMNKQPMIDFAAEWDITLEGDKAEEIRAELITLQMSLKDE